MRKKNCWIIVKSLSIHIFLIFYLEVKFNLQMIDYFSNTPSNSSLKQQQKQSPTNVLYMEKISKSVTELLVKIVDNQIFPFLPMRPQYYVEFWRPLEPLRKITKFHQISWCGICGRAQFLQSSGELPQNFHARKLSEITVFYAVNKEKH